MDSTLQFNPAMYEYKKRCLGMIGDLALSFTTDSVINQETLIPTHLL